MRAADSPGSGKKGEWCSYYLVTGRDTDSKQCQKQSIRTGSAADREATARIRCQLLFEFLDVVPQNEVLRIQDASNFSEYLVSDLAILRFQIEQRNISARLSLDTHHDLRVISIAVTTSSHL